MGVLDILMLLMMGAIAAGIGIGLFYLNRNPELEYETVDPRHQSNREIIENYMEALTRLPGNHPVVVQWREVTDAVLESENYPPLIDMRLHYDMWSYLNPYSKMLGDGECSPRARSLIIAREIRRRLNDIYKGQPVPLSPVPETIYEIWPLRVPEERVRSVH